MDNENLFECLLNRIKLGGSLNILPHQMTNNQIKEITKGWSSVSRPIIVTVIVIVIMVITIKPFFTLGLKKEFLVTVPIHSLK